MRVIIYAAGLSRRLGPVTNGGLKGMMLLNGRRLIEYQLSWIVACGIKEVVIVLGLEHQDFRDFLGENYRGLKIHYVYNPDYKTKGNMLSLWRARRFCDSDVIFTTSDLICNPKNISNFLQSGAKDKVLVDSACEKLFSDADPVKVTINSGRITNIHKDILNLESVDGVAVGVYAFSAKGISHILDSIEHKLSCGRDNLSLYKALDTVLLERTVKPVYTLTSEWIDIDTPDDLRSAQALISSCDDLSAQFLPS